MNNKVTVIMYHYVRELTKSKYPNIKGLDIEKFKSQINYLVNNYTILKMEDFIDAINNKTKLPDKSAILTFDDGYIDHFCQVLPILFNNNIQGSFFVPSRIIKESIVLDVNKIHFILEKEQNTKKILKEINNILFKHFKKYLESYNFSKINLKSRYDDKNTVLIKKLLQFILPEKERLLVVNKLFDQIINADICKFSQELYMNIKNIKEMSKNKMHFGSHGALHVRLGLLNKAKQEFDIKKSLSFFSKNNLNIKDFSICYPYGSYNQNSLQLSKKYKFIFGLTTEVGSVKKKNIKNFLNLPRFNANDFL
jgi:peptidoglycan/xylan/chitin deacetylase (PgdA/CDA1 family)